MSQIIPDTLLSELFLFSIEQLKFTTLTATKAADGMNENVNSLSMTVGGLWTSKKIQQLPR